MRAQLQCDSLTGMALISSNTDSLQQIVLQTVNSIQSLEMDLEMPLCAMIALHGFPPSQSQVNDPSISRSHAQSPSMSSSGGMIGIKKSEIARGLDDYEIFLNYESPCTDAFTSTPQNSVTFKSISL